jgi:uncharacterized protein YkwD
MGADELRLPSSRALPVTAYGRAVREGDAVVVTLKLAEGLPSTKPLDGAVKSSFSWREVTVKPGEAGVHVLDVAGQPVASDRVVQALKKATPVLIAASGPPDAFHLLTTKENTLIFVVPPDVLSPPADVPSNGETVEDLAKTEKAVLDLANAERKKVQLAPLVAHPLLMKAARQHSANMAKQGRLEHTLDQKSVGGRLTDVGYPWSRCGENIALGARTPAEAISGWMSSPGHRDNMLSKEYTHIGVASATGADGQQYWTMVLASPLR